VSTWRARRVLWLALALSILVHVAWSLWPADLPQTPEDKVLTATLTEMPAPPPPAAQPAPPKPRPKPRRHAAPPPPAPAPAPAPEAMAANEPPAQEAAPSAEAPVAEAPAPVAIEAPLAPPPAKVLPPRLDLAYKVYLGTQGFLIGEATYRFEHKGNQYRISTVAEARGLAALFVRGRGKVESRGLITAQGLQPLEFAVERGSSDRRESAQFDWESGVVTLFDDKTAPLEPPSYDPMTLMWQAYFTPPEAAVQTLNLVTTRRIFNYTIEREGTERITWAQGEVDTERWHRRSEDGKVDAYFWVSPEMHYALVKMRVTATARGTVEAVLDAIEVDPPAGE